MESFWGKNLHVDSKGDALSLSSNEGKKKALARGVAVCKHNHPHAIMKCLHIRYLRQYHLYNEIGGAGTVLGRALKPRR